MMASLFGALGSLAESYGLARQNIEESNLRRVQQQTEATRLGMEQQRLQLEQQQAEREKAYKPLVDIGLPSYTDPISKQQVYQRWSPTEGKIVKFPVSGGSDITAQMKQFISQADPKDQAYLAQYAQDMTSLSGDPREAAEKLYALGTTLRGKRETEQTEIEKEQRTKQAQIEKEGRQAVQARARRGELEAFQLRMQQQRFTENEKLNKNLLQTRQQTVAIDSTVKAINTILLNGNVLNSLLSAKKIDLAMDPDGFWSAAVSRTPGLGKLTDQEANVATAFATLSEGINLLRGPLAATGFRGPEAFKTLQAQRGNPLADPRITLGVLANTRTVFQNLDKVNKIQLQGTIQQIQDFNQQQPPVVLDLGDPTTE